MADLILVWARNTDDGQVNGFVVEKGSPGYQARGIEGKVSLRSVWQAGQPLARLRGTAAGPGTISSRDGRPLGQAARAATARPRPPPG